jgi:RNA polymerase sigma-70 factor (ECF subfamily)
MLEDAALIDLTLAGETEYFNVLVERYRPAVRSRIRSMSRNSIDEDDLLQEVFLKAWLHLSSFRSDASFRTWITRIAINEVLQSHRRNSRSPLLPANVDFDIFASDVDTPQESLQRKETIHNVHNAIAKLPAIYREIAVLRYLKQLNEEETARYMQASIALVKIRLFRARRLLSAALRRKVQQTSARPDRGVNNPSRADEPLGIAA